MVASTFQRLYLKRGTIYLTRCIGKYACGSPGSDSPGVGAHFLCGVAIEGGSFAGENSLPFAATEAMVSVSSLGSCGVATTILAFGSASVGAGILGKGR